MKKILVLNGSPRGEKSNTIKMTQSFCRGLEKTTNCSIQTLTVKNLKIEDCKGCFCCWTKTAGKCLIQDDMSWIIEEYIKADIVIWSFPLYYFGMPSRIKALMDRLLPTNQPIIEETSEGVGAHPSRYDLSHQKTILISSCGFHSRKGNYEGLIEQFNILQGAYQGATKGVKILCPEGELLSVKNLEGRTKQYLKKVEQAGLEYGKNGFISETTEVELEELLYPPKQFMEMANANWELKQVQPKSDQNREDLAHQEELFLKQMVASYRPEGYRKDLLIKIIFSGEMDSNKPYFLKVSTDSCELKTVKIGVPDLIIETPFDVWLEISEGQRNGAQAMMDGLYRVSGDFDIMNYLSDMFGGASQQSQEKKDQVEGHKSPNMNLFLFPWIALWVVLPIEAINHLAGIIAIGLCSLVALLGIKIKLTVYDHLTITLVPILGLLSLQNFDSIILICLSYFLFGMIWLISTLSPKPLTAHYSATRYGGSSAFDNPLFIKTNLILTKCWGFWYLLIAPISFFLLNSPLKQWTGVLNQVAPLFLGIFTIWFQKWYPSWIAGGKKVVKSETV